MKKLAGVLSMLAAAALLGGGAAVIGDGIRGQPSDQATLEQGSPDDAVVVARKKGRKKAHRSETALMETPIDVASLR